MLRNRLPARNKDGYRQLVQTVGYGIPNVDRAIASARNSLTLIAQQDIQPFARKKNGTGDRTKDMHVFALPWPKQALLDLPPTARVTVRVTLSYFVEPSPQEIGWKDRYRYASFGLRWDMIRRNERLPAFISRISAAIAEDEESDDRNDDGLRVGSDDRWTIGSVTRGRGSLHADLWMDASAADVADCGHLIVYPVIGWWRKRPRMGSLEKHARYSLVVGIESDDVAIDIYNPVVAVVNSVVVPIVI